MKIIAIFIIVICHVTSSLYGLGTDVNIERATPNMQHLTLSLFIYFGCLGNAIFFVASAWFLLESDKWSKKKELSMATDVWIVSIIFLIAMEIAQVNVSGLNVVKSLFPNTFCNSWYITCYLLFYPVHVLINRLINQIGQKSLLRLCLVLGFMYMGINFLLHSLFFPSVLIYWVVIYLIMAYGKLYLPQLMNSKKVNVILLVTGLVMNAILIIITNYLGLHFGAFIDKLLYWDRNNSPFLIMAAIGAFNLARQYTFYNKAINYISGLSLLIYIIHNNILVREYLRPAVWLWIQESLGFSNVVLWALGFALALFTASAVLAAVYKTTIGRLSYGFKNWIYAVAKKGYGKIESRILALK